jgi:hypothetical protein
VSEVRRDGADEEGAEGARNERHRLEIMEDYRSEPDEIDERERARDRIEVDDAPPVAF